jgi:hypothetical protein
VLTLNNSQVLIPSLTNVARMSLGGFYSILHSVYDKTNTTVTGTSLNAIDHSQVIVADSLTVNNSNFIANSTVLTFTPNTFNLGTSINGANGYTFLPNGFKLNWGWVSANSSTGDVTFSSAYTTNVYSVTATSNTAVATYQTSVISTNNTVACIRTANATVTNVFWQAIGY